MNESQYPDYITKMLADARLLLEEDDLTAPDAAAICFDVLALFPDCEEASNLVLMALNDPWLVRENRRAIERIIDEWDDRPWQQRRRLARSYGYICRWEGRHRQYDEDIDPEDLCPADVKVILEEGKSQLMQDYLLGQRQGREMAWPIFQEAIKRTQDRATAMFWVAQTYAAQGYFAESVELLEELLAQYPEEQDARRVWVEVRWWRDHQEKIPWLPSNSSAEGTRWRQMMRKTDAEFTVNEELYTTPIDYYHPPDAANLPQDFALTKPLSAEVLEQIEDSLHDD